MEATMRDIGYFHKNMVKELLIKQMAYRTMVPLLV